MAVEWEMTSQGQRKVEPKDVTKEKLAGQSPDDMDAFNLAYYEAPSAGVHVATY